MLSPLNLILVQFTVLQSFSTFTLRSTITPVLSQADVPLPSVPCKSHLQALCDFRGTCNRETDFFSAFYWNRIHFRSAKGHLSIRQNWSLSWRLRRYQWLKPSKKWMKSMFICLSLVVSYNISTTDSSVLGLTPIRLLLC